MQSRVDYVRIKDLMLLLARLHLDYEVVDIIVDPENKRVIIDPVEDVPENPNSVELRDNDLEELT